MIKKKVLVLTDGKPCGHRSIARAIFNFLKNNQKDEFEVEYREVKSDVFIVEDLYELIYKFCPKAGRLTYQLDKRNLLGKFGQNLSLRNLPGMKKVIEDVKPDLVISSFFFHTHALARWRKTGRKNFKLWTVVADPWTIYSISFIKDADLHLVYDEVGLDLAIKAGIPRDKVLKTGWWVRSEMYDKKFQISNVKCQIRQKLGFKDDRPVIFVGGGSLGTNALPKILLLLMSVRRKIGVIFNSGTDKLGFNLVEGYIKLFKKLGKDNLVQIKNLGWIDNMAEILSASDIVFGKAGPNFLFDVVALEKPFVSITHIGGQEDGNIDLILKKKLGWVKEKSSELSEFFLKYIENPKNYNIKFLKSIKKEKELNKKSLSLVLERVRNETK